MFQCSGLPCFKPDKIFQSIIVSVVIGLIIAVSATGQPVGQAAIKTEVLSPFVQFGYTFDISVNLDSVAPGFEMGGFDLLLGYDSSAITFISAARGQLLDDCEWEYFTYRSGINDTCIGDMCPKGLLRVIALADVSNGNFHPSCFGDSPGQLFTLKFKVTFNHAYECQFIPIQWFWMDCGDNGISSKYGESLFVSQNVFSSPPVLNITKDTTFPSPFGTPDACVDGTIGSGIRFIDFYNGGVEIVCPDSVPDYRGDLNLNGIYYEIADYNLYASYFLFGLSVFNVSMEDQVAASDVNADGLVLTFQDLIYLYRVIIGDTLPIYPSSTLLPLDTVLIVQDTINRKIAVEYSDSLSALSLHFNGWTEPSILIPEHEVRYDPDSNSNYVLVLPSLSSSALPTIGSETIMTYTGDVRLVGVSATYDGLSSIPTTVVFDTVGCCLYRGNVDMVVSSSGPIDVADLSYLVAYLFTGGPNPPCMEEGNVDGIEGPSGLIDVNDLSYLVAYLFSGGDAPPSCP